MCAYWYMDEEKKTSDSSGSGVQSYDPLTMEQHTSAIIYGSSFSGKTVLLHWICYQLRKRYDEVYLLSLIHISEPTRPY